MWIGTSQYGSVETELGLSDQWSHTWNTGLQTQSSKRLMMQENVKMKALTAKGEPVSRWKQWKKNIEVEAELESEAGSQGQDTALRRPIRVRNIRQDEVVKPKTTAVI